MPADAPIRTTPVTPAAPLNRKMVFTLIRKAGAAYAAATIFNAVDQPTGVTETHQEIPWRKLDSTHKE